MAFHASMGAMLQCSFGVAPSTLVSIPWIPGVPTVLESGMPAVDSNCKLTCQWGGVIQILSPGQIAVMGG